MTLQVGAEVASPTVTLPAAVGQHRRHVSSSAAAARDAIQGDIIAPDVGLARIDG